MESYYNNNYSHYEDPYSYQPSPYTTPSLYRPDYSESYLYPPVSSPSYYYPPGSSQSYSYHANVVDSIHYSNPYDYPPSPQPKQCHYPPDYFESAPLNSNSKMDFSPETVASIQHKLSNMLITLNKMREIGAQSLAPSITNAALAGEAMTEDQVENELLEATESDSDVIDAVKAEEQRDNQPLDLKKISDDFSMLLDDVTTQEDVTIGVDCNETSPTLSTRRKGAHAEQLYDEMYSREDLFCHFSLSSGTKLMHSFWLNCSFGDTRLPGGSHFLGVDDMVRKMEIIAMGTSKLSVEENDRKRCSSNWC